MHNHTALAILGLTALLFAGTVVPASAQDASTPVWGHLYPTEQQRDRLADDPTAGASVVFDRGLITVGPGFKFTFERHRRVQIFRADAYRFANVEIPYHASEKIELIEAHTLTQDGRRVKVEPKQFFETETGDWKTRVFAFPDVSPGCVVEYRYKVVSRNFYYLRPWMFQDEVPVEYSEIAVRLPEGFEYAAVVNNADYVDGPDTTEFLSMLHHKQKVQEFTWRTRNLPPLVSEKCVTSLLDHRVALDFQIVRYRDGGHVWEFVDSWSDLAGQVKQAYDPLLRTDDNWPTWSVPEDVVPAVAQRARARSVYEYVRDSIALAGQAFSVFDGGLKSARRIMSQRRGNALEKNLCLVALLRHNGLSAWPVLISRRSHLRFDGRDHRLEQFDHAVVLLEIEGERYFCEANVPNAWLGYLPPDDQVDAGVVIGYPDPDLTVVDLPAPPVDRDVVADATIDLQSDGSATGRLELWVGGQAAYELLCATADNDTIGYVHKHWLPGIIPHNITITRDTKDDWTPLHLIVEFDWPDAASVDGNRLFLYPSTLHKLNENPLMTSQRRYPISFETPWSEDWRLTWRIPEGFTINTLPRSRNVIGDGYTLRSSLSVDDREIVTQRFWQVRRRDFSVKCFENLREMFNAVQLSQRDLLVLYREEP